MCLFFQILDNLQLTLDISNSEGGLKGYIQYDQKRDSESSRYGIGISIGFTLKRPMKRVQHDQVTRLITESLGHGQPTVFIFQPSDVGVVIDQ